MNAFIPIKRPGMGRCREVRALREHVQCEVFFGLTGFILLHQQVKNWFLLLPGFCNFSCLVGIFRADSTYYQHTSLRRLSCTADTAANYAEKQVSGLVKAVITDKKPTFTNRQNTPGPTAAIPAMWTRDTQEKRRGISFFVRGKARGNTEQYAQIHSVPVVTNETYYDA